MWYYLVFFGVSGLFQSIGWPNFISVMGNWFPKKSRGVVFGFWCTCQNVGNIGGVILINVLRSGTGMNWMWSLRIVGIWVGILGVLNFLLLVEDPAKVGIIIGLPEEEESEEETNKRESWPQKLIIEESKNDEEKNILNNPKTNRNEISLKGESSVSIEKSMNSSE